MRVPMRDRKNCDHRQRGGDRHPARPGHEYPEHDDRDGDQQFTCGQRHPDHAERATERHDQRKRDRQQPDRGRTKLGAPDPDADHRQQMVEPGQRVQKPGAEPGGGAAGRVRQRRLSDEQQRSRNGHSERGLPCDSLHLIRFRIVAPRRGSPALRAACRGGGRIDKAARSKAAPKFRPVPDNRACWHMPEYATVSHIKARTGERPMTRPKLERTLFGAAAALSLSLGVPALAADHRDAPTIDDYSAIDINDVYMFRDPPNCSPGPGCNLVVALSTQAVADPQFGPSYHFQENALYRLNFTTRQDARPTASIDFVFGPFGNGPDCLAPHDACQTFRAVFPNKVVVEGFTTQGTFDATHQVPRSRPAATSRFSPGCAKTRSFLTPSGSTAPSHRGEHSSTALL